MAPLHVASLGRQWPQASEPFTPSTVEDHPHVPILVGEYLLDVPVCLWLGARHDEDQVCHARIRCIQVLCFTQGRTPEQRSALRPSAVESCVVRRLRDTKD